MPVFAPLYRLAQSQQTHLARQQKPGSRKRRRGSDTSAEGGNVSDDDHNDPITAAARQSSRPAATAEQSTASTLHPLSKKDPFYIAGHTRELPLPPPPFPHASPKPFFPAKPAPLEETLAQLNPPLYFLPNKTTSSYDNDVDARRAGKDGGASSSHRRHVDNLTTILFLSLQRRDWARASRAWGLLLRVTVSGVGVLLRRDGVWGVGGEVLLRQQPASQSQEDRVGREKRLGGRRKNGGVGALHGTSGLGDDGDEPSDEEDGDDDHSSADHDDGQGFSEEGFEAAKAFYERLILHNPNTSRTQNFFNAAHVYPAFFSVWVFQVCWRSDVARKKLERAIERKRRKGGRASSSQDDDDDDEDDDEGEDEDGASDESGTRRSRRARKAISSAEAEAEEEELRQEHSISSRELQDAMEIMRRVDQLTLTPPYDSDEDLLILRAMLELWVADLHEKLGSNSRSVRERRTGPGGNFKTEDEGSGADLRMVLEMEVEEERHRLEAAESRARADGMIRRLEEMGLDVPEDMKAPRKGRYRSTMVG